MASEERKVEAVTSDTVETVEADGNENRKAEDEIQNAKSDDKDGEASDQDGPADNDDDTADVTDLTDGKVSNDLYKAYKAITEVLLNFKIKSKNNEEHFPSTLFKRLPNKRLLPEYYEVIKEPSAISTLRGKIQRKQYTGTPEFVRDFALICHNAQVFNRPNSQPVRDVLKLEEVFKEELKKLADDGLATAEETTIPDLGEIPYSTPEPDPVSEEDEGEEDADDDEDDDEADDSDDDRRGRRGRKGGRPVPGKKGNEEEDEDKGGDAEQKRRGRPPKVATPMEHRIDRILKSLKKAKAHNGQTMIIPFERLPDKTEFPDYYEVIKEPMAFDILKKKAKRKKYTSIEEFMRDVNLMFKNAMTYNEDSSDVYKWSQDLLEEAKRAEAEERAKPDSEYLSAADGRIPLPHIIYKGDMWKVGDWIHVQNPNDITKPIIAQIYRTWKTANDEEWINACWYYRPEQTVHQHEKHFYPKEVVKTGQYRDHKIEELLNKCFVMFYTRYSRGRPRNLAADTEVYVCEARYNEDKFKFNKIKTWASCLPDEVRDKDYEMDLFDAPRRIKKVPSPLLSRLKEDAKDTDELPQPEWKHANAPPLVGGIHRRPRDENQSPPPEPTPPPQALPTPIMRTPSVNQQINMRVQNYNPASGPVDAAAQPLRTTPALTPQPSFGNSQTNRQPSFNATQYNHPQGTAAQPASQYQYNPQQHQSAALGAAHSTPYNAQTSGYGRTTSANLPPVQYNAQPVNTIFSDRTAEVYVLSDAANLAIPKDLREQFPTDDQGRVLFFTTPPLAADQTVSSTYTKGGDEPLKHSKQYTEALALRKRKHMGHEAEDRMEIDHTEVKDASQNMQIRLNGDIFKQNSDIEAHHQAQGVKAFAALTERMQTSAEDEYKARYSSQWSELQADDLQWAKRRKELDIAQDREAQEKRHALRNAHLGRFNGQYGVNAQGYISGWQKDLYTGTYLDDVDSRLPF